MREAVGKITESIELRCAAEAVWRILVDVESYGEWFDIDRKQTLRTVEPEFCEGGRLVFNDLKASSKIITTCRKNKELSFGDDFSKETFLLQETQRGAKLTVTIELAEIENLDMAVIKSKAAAMLRSIKLLAYDRNEGSFEHSPKRKDRKKIPITTRVFTIVFKGYKTAELHDTSRVRIKSQINQEISPNRWQTMAGALFAIGLFIVLIYTTAIDKPDVVRSSGLSIYQSETITKQVVETIDFDETKLFLERNLSCVGMPVYDDLFSYSSVDTFNGEPAVQMFIMYDTHNIVRRYGVLDYKQSYQRYYGEIKNFCETISPDMTYTEIETVVGQKLSGFDVDKNGTARYFFGKIDERRDIFDRYIYAELVITIDSINDVVKCEYYYPPILSGNLPINDLSTSIERQFSEEREYEASKLYGDRVVLLQGLSKQQVETVLSVDGVEITDNEYQYDVPPPYDDNEAQGFTYKVLYQDDIAVSVVFVNNKLLTLERDTLLESLTGELAVGMSGNLVEQRMGIVPTAIYTDGESITCVYGTTGAIDFAQSETNEFIELLRQQAPISITLETDEMTVIEILSNQ